MSELIYQNLLTLFIFAKIDHQQLRFLQVVLWERRIEMDYTLDDEATYV